MMDNVLYAQQMADSENEKMVKAIKSFPKKEKEFPDITDFNDPTWFKSKGDARECKRQLESSTGLLYVIVWRNDGFAVEPANIIDMDGLTIEKNDVLYDISGSAYHVIDIKRGDDTFYELHLTDSHERLEVVEDEAAKKRFRHMPWTAEELAVYKEGLTKEQKKADFERTVHRFWSSVSDFIDANTWVIGLLISLPMAICLVIAITLVETEPIQQTEAPAPAPVSIEIPCEVEELSSDRRWVNNHYRDYYYISLSDENGKTMRFSCTETLWESLKQGDSVTVRYEEEVVQNPLLGNYTTQTYICNGQELHGITEISNQKEER